MLFNLKSVFCLLQAFMFVVSSFAVKDSKFKKWVDSTALNMTSDIYFDFDNITSDELKVSENEKKKCREWFENNIIGGTPAYDFTVGGKSFRRNPGDWEIKPGKESQKGEFHRGGKTVFVELKHKESGLEATVEATIYEEFATCEWTVFIKNNGSENSPVIKNFYGADCKFEIEKPTLYVSRGSDNKAEDFELLRTAVNPIPMVFTADGGRSGTFLPYFNLSGKNGGVLLATGWTGQWYTSLAQKINGVDVKAKQETFKAYLTPGEQVRSPLVSVTFYEGDNALKGFNTFRNFESACVYTESAFPLTCTVIAGEFDRRNADEYIAQINSYDETTCKNTDFLWRDAGWYKINGDWYDSVGNWVADPERFPEGLAPVADAAKARGMELLLWYEPERCCKDTIVYNECIKHDGWLIQCDDNINMVNLAFDGACDFLGNLVAGSIKENHVGLYRQDFNFTPLPLWEDADKAYWDGRKGIEENHYVTNLYRYLDTLIEVNPGLIIDNCASGGRRLDLEMSRRSIPLWRTDYNCSDAEGNINADSIEATQSMTYGLSFWLPLNGTGLNAYGEYAERSLITTCTQRAGFEEIRRLMDKNYYPLTYGARDLDKYHAMQFGDEKEGVALIYKRENASSDKYLLKLNGLDTDKTYTVTDYDGNNQTVSLSGAELMSGGIEISVKDAPKCEIILYKAA